MSEQEKDSSSAVEAQEAEDEVITLQEFLDEQRQLQRNANAVLGPSESTSCTYSEGYVKRQALYACRTCVPDGSRPAGVCLACSDSCHEGHELIELYTKRNFRCDCGNSKFSNFSCKLKPDKDDENKENAYNQNFEGAYCSCKRPYPDPEDTEPDEMIQCSICEDWFHFKHLGTEVPSEENLGEMICRTCMERLPFLNRYLGYAVTSISKEKKEEDGQLDVTSSDTEQASNIVTSSSSDPKDVESKSGTSKVVDSAGECTFKNLKELPANGAVFWIKTFRSILCKCSSCMEMYEKAGVGWLPDETDTTSFYEAQGREEEEEEEEDSYSGPESIQRALMEMASAGIDRFTQAEAILNYNEMKTNLTEFFLKFARNGKVVRAEDIKEFFTDMSQRKRQKLDVPYNCH